MNATVYITLLRILLIFLLTPATAGLAQQPSAAAEVAPAANPLTDHDKMVYGVVSNILLRSAELMPEEKYSFKPVETVRTFGQIVGHVVDTQYYFCSTVLGEKAPALNIEGTKTTKAELIAALREVFVYCDKAFSGLTDASATDLASFRGGTPKLSVMNINSLHSMQHYGNLSTYMRMNNVIPPSSDREFMKQQGNKK